METEKVFIFNNTEGQAVVLEAVGLNVQDLATTSCAFEDWPDDLGVPERSGLLIWEGEVLHDRDKGQYVFTGELRDLRPDEWDRLKIKESPFPELNQ